MTNILIVEDNVLTQRVLGMALRSAGYTIVTAANGREALERLNDTPVDLIVTDVAMPYMDGLTLLRHIRNDELYAALPVVVLTANGQTTVRDQAIMLGADGFLTKPTGSRELLETISRFVYAQI